MLVKTLRSLAPIICLLWLASDLRAQDAFGTKFFDNLTSLFGRLQKSKLDTVNPSLAVSPTLFNLRQRHISDIPGYRKSGVVQKQTAVKFLTTRPLGRLEI